MFFVYLIENYNGQFYIGFTDDLNRRLDEHRRGKVTTTNRLRFKRLLYFEAYTSKEAAQDREKKLKQFGSSYHGLIKRLKLNRS